MRSIDIHENGLYIVYEVGDYDELRLMHLSGLPYRPEDVNETYKWRFRAMEVHATGENQGDHQRPEAYGIESRRADEIRLARGFSQRNRTKAGNRAA